MAEIELNRRELIVAGAVALTAGPAWAAESGALHFLAIGDFGRDGQYHQRDVAEQMGKVAAQVHSSFVLTVGDNFYPDGVRSLDDPKWRTSFEDVYVAPSLQTPWYAALGNHDYHVTPQVEVDYTRVSKRWRMPSRYYSVPQLSLIHI